MKKENKIIRVCQNLSCCLTLLFQNNFVLLCQAFLALFPPFKLFLTFKEMIKLTKKIIDFPEWPVLALTSIQHVCTALWSCHMGNQTSKESRNGANLLW